MIYDFYFEILPSTTSLSSAGVITKLEDAMNVEGRTFVGWSAIGFHVQKYA